MEKDKIIKLGIGGLILIIALVAFMVKGSGENNLQIETTNASNITVEAITITEQAIEKNIIVDIAGAVNSPNVAKLKEGSRVYEAIQAVGGLTQEADTTSINMAAILQDGEKIYVPRRGEMPPVNTTSTLGNNVGTFNPSTSTNGKVNINTATIDQLQTLNGVGPSTAQKIIDHRTQNGAFRTTEDLKNVSGIGDKTFEKFKENITV